MSENEDLPISEDELIEDMGKGYRYYIVLITGNEAPHVLEFSHGDELVKNLRMLLMHHAGTGTHLFAFKGTRVYFTDVQSVVGIDLNEGGPAIPVVLQEPKKNTSGLVPYVVPDDAE